MLRSTLVLVHAGAGLAGLVAGLAAYRLWRAHHEARRRADGWQARYVGHVYFTYISLWVGFLVVPALRLPSPQVAVPLVVGATLVTGHVILTRYKRGVLRPPAGPRDTAAAAMAEDRPVR